MASELDFGDLQSRLSTFLLLFGVPHVGDMSQIALISPKERRTETTTGLNDVRAQRRRRSRRRRRNGVKRDKGYQVAVPKLATMGPWKGGDTRDGPNCFVTRRQNIRRNPIKCVLTQPTSKEPLKIDGIDRTDLDLIKSSKEA